MKLRRAFPGLAWKATLGGLAASLATIFGALAGMVLIGASASEIERKVAVVADEAARFDQPYLPLLVSPVLETILFLVAFKLLQAARIARRRSAYILAMALVMGLVGWLLHDARDSMVPQSFGFAVLGALFAALWFQSGGIVAFAGTALAHMIWNATVMALALVYAPRVVWEGRVQHAVSDGTRIDIVGDFETPDRCRRAGVMHLQRLHARRDAGRLEDSPGRITCERAIRSGRSFR